MNRPVTRSTRGGALRIFGSFIRDDNNVQPAAAISRQENCMWLKSFESGGVESLS
jgi:hypothetical protein